MSMGDWLAIYGAALATFLAYKEWRRDRGRFVLNPVTLDILLRNFDSSRDDKVTWRSVEVINFGIRPLYLDDFGFATTDGTRISLRKSDTEYPLRLDESERHSSLTIGEQYATEILDYLWATDTRGKEYRSRKRPFK